MGLTSYMLFSGQPAHSILQKLVRGHICIVLTFRVSVSFLSWKNTADAHIVPVKEHIFIPSVIL